MHSLSNDRSGVDITAHSQPHQPYIRQSIYRTIHSITDKQYNPTTIHDLTDPKWQRPLVGPLQTVRVRLDEPHRSKSVLEHTMMRVH